MVLTFFLGEDLECDLNNDVEDDLELDDKRRVCLFTLDLSRFVLFLLICDLEYDLFDNDLEADFDDDLEIDLDLYQACLSGFFFCDLLLLVLVTFLSWSN